MNRQSNIFWIGVGVLLILIDQVLKYLAAHYFGWPIFLNDQFAFSLPVPKFAMYSLYAVIELAIIYYVIDTFSRQNTRERIAWTLVLAGSISNIAERLVYGAVRDYIPLLGGILNAADFYILVGVAILLFGNFYFRKS